jgi:menaquinol-cytochrome c reductase iron-sulfur subunit
MKSKGNSSQLTRRDFVKVVSTFLGTIIGAVLGISAIGYLISPARSDPKLDDWVSLGPLETYPIGLPTRFNFTRSKTHGWEKNVYSYGVYVLRKSHEQVRVFSDICTHLGCRVTWHADIQEYVSPCHDGHFDIDGNVTKGPPPRPLDQYEAKIEDGNLFLHLTS